jgi:hypothetical protein
MNKLLKSSLVAASVLALSLSLSSTSASAGNNYSWSGNAFSQLAASINTSNVAPRAPYG